jgi:membrane protease YdiL (CAAX protease family)
MISSPVKLSFSAIFNDLKPFLLTSFVFSWTVFILVDGLLIPMYVGQHRYASANLVALFGHGLAMFGPALGAWISWKRFRIGKVPNWIWSRGSYYIVAVCLLFCYWIVPAILCVAFSGRYSFISPHEPFQKILIVSGFSLYWLCGLGEEIGWCGFLIPALTERTSVMNSLVISGAIRGLWHLPILAAPMVRQVASNQKTVSWMLIMTLVYAVQLMMSNVAFGSFYFWIWRKTKSLTLAGWFHQWYDSFRDIAMLLIANYRASQWVKLYSGLAMGLSAGYVIMLILRNSAAGIGPSQKIPLVETSDGGDLD